MLLHDKNSKNSNNNNNNNNNNIVVLIVIGVIHAFCVIRISDLASASSQTASKSSDLNDYEYYYEYNNSASAILDNDNNNNDNSNKNNNDNLNSNQNKQINLLDNGSNANSNDNKSNDDDWPSIGDDTLVDEDHEQPINSSNATTATTTTTVTRQQHQIRVNNNGDSGQLAEVLSDTLIEETCKLDRGCMRRDHLNNTYLAHCHRYKLEYLFSSVILMEIMHGEEEKCQSILKEFMQLDEVVSQFDKLFNNLLTRYNCHNGYSVKWTCQDCKKAYKDWLCAINLPYYMHGEQVKPCISFCERVEQRCPYLHPITREQYGGQPVFICRDPNIPFVPSITPSIPYSEPTRCYELCHLSDNETELINDSLSKYAYNDCPHRDSIAEEVRSDPLYNRCHWSPDGGAHSTMSAQSAATSGHNSISSSSSSSSNGALADAGVVGGNREVGVTGRDDAASGGQVVPLDNVDGSTSQHPQPGENNNMNMNTGNDAMMQYDGEMMLTNKQHSTGPAQWGQKAGAGPAATTTATATIIAAPTTTTASTTRQLTGNIINDDDDVTTTAAAATTNKTEPHNGHDTTATTATTTTHTVRQQYNMSTGNGYELPFIGDPQQQHVHNKTLAELRDILHQYKSQPKHRPGEHGSGSHLHHLHDYSVN